MSTALFVVGLLTAVFCGFETLAATCPLVHRVFLAVCALLGWALMIFVLLMERLP